MPDMQPTPEVKAILVSDLHLQQRPPLARACEPDWFASMAQPLVELRSLKKRYNNVPIFYAGDIFDRWNSPPEVINFALKNLPRGYSIPGQHDLPNHNYMEIHRSAYWTLVESGTLVNLPPSQPHAISLKRNIVVYGYPWGYDPKPITPDDGTFNLALIHAFVCTKDTAYQNAPVTSRIGAYRKALKGYDAVAFGDNHKGFIKKIPDGAWVCNCGGLMRRKTDEINYRPGCGLLHADGSISRHYFDTSKEHFETVSESEGILSDNFDMAAFTEALNDLGRDGSFDFISALKRTISDNKVPENIAKIILNACDEGVPK